MCTWCVGVWKLQGVRDRETEDLQDLALAIGAFDVAAAGICTALIGGDAVCVQGEQVPMSKL